jgi:hypothetical protein
VTTPRSTERTTPRKTRGRLAPRGRPSALPVATACRRAAPRGGGAQRSIAARWRACRAAETRAGAAAPACARRTPRSVRATACRPATRPVRGGARRSARPVHVSPARAWASAYRGPPSARAPAPPPAYRPAPPPASGRIRCRAAASSAVTASAPDRARAERRSARATPSRRASRGRGVTPCPARARRACRESVPVRAPPARPSARAPGCARATRTVRGMRRPGAPMRA